MPRFLDISDINAAWDAFRLSEAIENIVGNYTQATLDLVARMTVRPDADRRDAIDTLISTLQDDGIWDKLDGLYVLAAHTEQAALLNWVEDARNLTAYNSPTFDVDEGFTGDGVTSYLQAGPFAGNLLGLDQGDESIGVWTRTSVAEDKNQFVIGTTSQGSSSSRYLNTRQSTTGVGWRINQSGGQSSGAHTTANNVFVLATYDGSTGYEYFNGAEDDTVVQAPFDDPHALTFYATLLRNNANYSTKQVGAACYGQHMTATEAALFYDALLTYMTAVGALA